MTLQELTNKINSGQALSAEEQKEFFAAIDEELKKLKQEQPEKYLEFLTEMNRIVTELNTKLKAAQDGLKN